MFLCPASISIHALREEGDLLPAACTRPPWIFLSTPSARRATEGDGAKLETLQFLSTPSARRATQSGRPDRDRCVISIHALREEGDLFDDVFIFISFLFLSTPSARRATWAASGWAMVPPYFYPRPPRGGRPARADRREVGAGISIHALREEGDRSPTTPPTTENKFLSTPSARRATPEWCADGPSCADFYPRPPRGGRLHKSKSAKRVRDFYPRPPRGGRRAACSLSVRLILFLSTPSARRATSGWTKWASKISNFYPRPPRGGRPSRLPQTYTEYIFLSTPSARRATCRSALPASTSGHFYPRPPRGGRPAWCFWTGAAASFLSTPSARRATTIWMQPMSR